MATAVDVCTLAAEGMILICVLEEDRGSRLCEREFSCSCCLTGYGTECRTRNSHGHIYSAYLQSIIAISYYHTIFKEDSFVSLIHSTAPLHSSLLSSVLLSQPFHLSSLLLYYDLCDVNRMD